LQEKANKPDRRTEAEEQQRAFFFPPARPIDRSIDRTTPEESAAALPSVCSNAPTARIARVAFVLPHPIYSCGEVI